MIQKLIPSIFLKSGKLMASFNSKDVVSDSPETYCSNLNARGADGIIIFDLSDDDASHEESLLTIRRISEMVECELIGAGNIKRLEDVKKLLYAGCDRVALNLSKQSNIELIEEAGKRFGKDSIYSCVDVDEQILSNIESLRKYTSVSIVIDNYENGSFSDLPIIVMLSDDSILSKIDKDSTYGISGEYVNKNAEDLFRTKEELKSLLNVKINTSPYNWNDFKLNSDNHLTVVVQDIKTDEVLMVAYMDEKAYMETIRTGIMTYYSRSRNELWKKGDTSGHYQYVKELKADCDMDTLVAKVVQIGNACHTGAHSCFFNKIMDIPYDTVNPYKVFDDLLNVIKDRKNNPKEESYTNYLFDKGIDKILKKVGEEATEIVIAAKNPEKEEVKYEIADFLYHAMVLMVECELDWEDITKELANR